MSITSIRKELFRPATTREKLSHFQSLFDSEQLDANASLALLNLIHRELAAEEGYDHSLYKRYAEKIEVLRFYMSDVLQEVVNEWEKR